MLIAIFSDSHDNIDNITKALELAKDRGISQGIHLGDFCAPPALELLAKSGLRWYCVWGNVDGDKLLSYQRVAPYGTVDLVSTDFRELDIEGRKLFLTHYPEIARIAALSGQYDAAFHGHTHLAASETINVNNKQVLLANPGEIAGFRYGKPSFGIYNTETNILEHLALA